VLYLARYEIELENVETAMAKRMEWENVAPDGFRMVCEYAVHGQPPPFGGFMVFSTDAAEDLNFLILYYGKTVRLDIRPCSNVLEAMEMTRKSLSASR
jgi:hypothetical protein